MANIFDVTNERNNNVPQNAFDWSHQSNITGRLGFIYPFFCDLVPAKTTFRTIPKLGLQFMPMVFPVQTRMKARVSFFRMPLRSLWKDYKDYVGNFRTGLVEPYLDLATSFEKFMGTGKLADYLDIPTVLSGDYSESFRVDFEQPNVLEPYQGDGSFRPCQFLTSDDVPDGNYLAERRELYFGGTAGSVQLQADAMYYARKVDPLSYEYGKLNVRESNFVAPTFAYNVSDISSGLFTEVASFLIAVKRPVDYSSETSSNSGLVNSVIPLQSDSGYLSFDVVDKSDYRTFTCGRQHASDTVTTVNIPKGDFDYYLVYAFYYDGRGNLVDISSSEWLYPEANYLGNVGPSSFNFLASSQALNADGYVEINRENSPYYDSTALRKDEQIRLKAYAPRAYEAIYNAYMRDNRNNPYYRNGQVEYNVWIPTDEGGADTYPYELHRANWEKDFLTTAVPSPQQGKAPLVGLTTYATTEDVDGITKTSLKMALVDEDGKRYALKFSSSDDGVDGVEYAELSDGVSPQSLSYRSLVDAASTGISIPDLRMVNAYQKFLELNMRKGYSYKEIIEGRFDCQVRYDDLNMPEFIGGFTRDVNMNRVVQSVERNATEEYPEGSYANALGSLAGDAFLAAEGSQISCFCDEESIIMGVISVVPVPCYSQLLPKHYLYSDLLDHFQPEFDNIGFQPITYKEVCPIQAFNAHENLNGVFGYQRPWYEYVQKTDKVHGLFRTQLRNFLMNRVFDVKPELTKSFLLVDDEQLNDVFAVTDTTDKFMGQIWLDCSVQLPISRVSIPRLD